MEQKQLTARQFRERWLLLRAPVVLAPLLTLVFFGLGGGRVSAHAAAGPLARGINLRVPGPRLPSNSLTDKLGMYEQEARDSLAREQRMKMEREYAEKIGLVVGGDSVGAPAPKSVRPDALVKKAQEKLAALQRVISSPPGTGLPVSGGKATTPGGILSLTPRPDYKSPDVAKLERIMGVLKQKEEEPDPEMGELNGMLDKLVALQSPRKDSAKGTASKVVRDVAMVQVVPEDGDTSKGQEIEAMVPEDQKLASGAQVRLELISTIRVGGLIISAGTTIYGVTSLNGERLRVSITSLHAGGRVVPVKLEVFDQDGMAGIYIPGVPASDALRESAGQDAGSFEPGLLSTTAAGQATGAGIQLARNMVSKRLRIIRVTVPGGYQVFLKPQND